jgi:hypothetical protein
MYILYITILLLLKNSAKVGGHIWSENGRRRRSVSALESLIFFFSFEPRMMWLCCKLVEQHGSECHFGTHLLGFIKEILAKYKKLGNFFNF